MATGKEVLDQFLDGRDPQELFAKGGLIDELKKALSQRMLAAELDDHLETETEASGATDAVVETVNEWQGRGSRPPARRLLSAGVLRRDPGQNPR